MFRPGRSGGRGGPAGDQGRWQQRTAQTNLVTVASSPVSFHHCSGPLTSLYHTLLRAPFIPPPNAHVSTVFPALKRPGTARCSPDKTQPPQRHGPPLAVQSSPLHPALDSCPTGPRTPPAHITPSPRELSSPHPPAAGALRWGGSRPRSRPTPTCAGYTRHCRRLRTVGTRLGACRN